jgi:Uma2 family endonuclease
MALLALPTDELKRIVARRRRLGIDKFDEVWDGVYVMSPLADPEHQDIVGEFDSLFRAIVKREGLGLVYPGVNVSDLPLKWRNNYRCPDVAVFLAGNPAEDRGAYWFGGPDFAVEVLSPRDRARKKLGFYARVGTRELLLVDRAPWALELYRLDDGAMRRVGTSTMEHSDTIASAVLPLSFRLIAGETAERPRIEARHDTDGRTWTI